MLGVALDAVVLAVLVPMLRENEDLDFPKMLLGAVLMAAVNWGLVAGFTVLELGPVIYLGLLSAIDAAFIRWWCRLTWTRSAIVVAVLLGLKIGLALLMRS